MKKYRFHIIKKSDGALYDIAFRYHHEVHGRVCRVSRTGISIAYDGKFYTCFEDYNIYT